MSNGGLKKVQPNSLDVKTRSRSLSLGNVSRPKLENKESNSPKIDDKKTPTSKPLIPKVPKKTYIHYEIGFD